MWEIKKAYMDPVKTETGLKEWSWFADCSLAESGWEWLILDPSHTCLALTQKPGIVSMCHVKFIYMILNPKVEALMSDKDFEYAV